MASKLVDVGGGKIIEFPDGMSDDDISKALSADQPTPGMEKLGGAPPPVASAPLPFTLHPRQIGAHGIPPGTPIAGSPLFPSSAAIPTLVAAGLSKLDQLTKGPASANDPFGGVPVAGAPVIPRPDPSEGNMLKPLPGSNFIDNATHINPTRNVIKALKPTSANTDFMETAPGALADIKSMEDPANPIQNNEDFRRVAQSYLDKNRQAMDAYEAVPHAIGASVEGAPITQSMMDAAGDMMKREDPDAYELLQKKADRWSGPITLKDLKGLQQEGNKRMNGFYNASPDKQAAQLGAGLNPAIEEAKLSQIRDLRYNGLDPENSGAGPREIQSRYGAVADLLNASNKRRNSILGEQPETPFAGLREDILQNARLIKHGGEQSKNSDALIRRAMANVTPSDGHPSPADTPAVAGYLGPGAVRMEAGPDGSYVRAADGMYAPPNSTRALPPASTIFQPGVADASGVSATGAPPAGFPVGFSQRQLPAAPRSTGPVDVPLGSQHGDLTGPRAGESMPEFVSRVLFPPKK